MTSPLKIAHVVESTSAGVGRHVMDLIGGLLARGHEISLFHSPTRSDSRFRLLLDAYRGVPNFFDIAHPMQHGLHGSDLGAALAVRHRFRSGFDIVHSHSTKAGLVARAGLAGCGVGRVYTPHAPVTMDESRGLGFRGLARVMEVGLAHLCDRIIAVSELEKQHLAGLGIDQRKLRVVSNGVEESVASVRRERRRQARHTLRLDDSVICIGFVGRLTPQKNPELLLRALAQLPESMHVAIAGEGSLERHLRALASRLGVAGRVHWLGAVNGVDWMPSFDVLAVTSNYEGQPYVVLEALSAGLPLVMTDVGGSELVHNGENGFVVRRGAVSDLAQAVEAASAARDRFGAMSLKCAEQFSVDAMVDNTLSVYEEILLASPRGELSWLPSPIVKSRS